MPKKPIERCPHCDAKMVEYKHSLNRALVRALAFVKDQGGVVDYRAMEGHLTFNQRSNFPKLQYWGLIQKHKDDDGTRQGGRWAITQSGRDFLANEWSVPRFAVSYRNNFVRFEGPDVSVRSVSSEAFRTREDYVADQVPRIGDIPIDFF